MRRSLAAAALALAALASPASAAIEPWKIIGDVFGECMDCFPQVMCVNYPRCPLAEVIDPPTP